MREIDTFISDSETQPSPKVGIRVGDFVAYWPDEVKLPKVGTVIKMPEGSAVIQVASSELFGVDNNDPNVIVLSRWAEPAEQTPKAHFQPELF